MAYDTSFDALFAGRLSVTWYASVAVKGQRKPKLEKVAAGGSSFAVSGAQPITVSLTPAGASLLRQSGGRPLIAKLTFVPVGEHAVSTSTGFSL